MNKSKLLRITALFFVLMILFTILSRAAYQEGTAVAATGRPSSMVIEHRIECSGKIQENQELAVTTQPDQRITSIAVQEGQMVKKGDLLFEIDLDVLEEKILSQQQEIEKHQLQSADVKSQQEVKKEQRANEQAQASEQYSLSVGKANTLLKRSKQELAEAKQALADYGKNNSQTQQAEDTVEQALQQDCDEKTEAYIQAENDLSKLQWEIEDAVEKALEQAASGASLSPNTWTKTQSSEEEAIVMDAEEQTMVEPDMVESGYSAEGILVGDDTTGEAYGNQTMEQADTGDLIIEDLEIDIPEPAAPSSDLPEPEVLESEVPESILPESKVPESEVSETDVSETEGPDLVLLEAQIRNSYEPELTAAQQKAEQALKEKKNAETVLEQYQTEQLSAAGSAERQSRQQLIANVKAAQSAYEDAAIAANEAAVTSGRAVQTANISEASDSSQRLNEITGQQMQLALDKLEKLKQNKGRVTAPEDGLITSVLVQAGEKTTDTAALRMTNLSKGYRFSGELSKGQEKYIGTGDLVTLTGSSQKSYTDLEVEAVTVDEADESIYHIMVPIPEDTLALGAGATLTFAKKSKAYSTVVPLSALHLDEKNQPYVLVVDESESIMGTEQKARKVKVTILEQNESYAALAEGAVTASQEIIISSSKAVDDGSRVRTEKGS